MTASEQQRPEIVVGLVATPPDQPARVATRLTAELASGLTERVSADVRWTIREGWGRWRRAATAALRPYSTTLLDGAPTTSGTSPSA
ncbi:hypothetical protein [Micromonospora sp. ALFpr18c]|uniref:hypothetical protein n=1 Tax=unclassified Micromonospora TaxID=2617518 RepID=UPI001CED1B7C|nr:hypothetical protein [Micromonospora sp. ALFpr18c]